jgi:hypothetical protein
MKSAADVWNRFWFAPAPTTTLSALRVGVGILALVSGLVLLPDTEAFYAPTRIGTTVARFIDAALIVAAVCLVIGFRTRAASIAVAGGLIILSNANPVIFNGGDSLLRHLAVVVALAPAGVGLSLDRRRLRGEWWDCPAAPVWPVRLVQIQVAVMYAAAVAHKLGGVTWWDGTAASYPLRIATVTRFPVFAGVADSPVVAYLLTWGTLAIEAAIPLLVWNRKCRPWVLALGIGLHLSFDVALRAGLFSWVVFVAYVAFVPPETMGAVFARLGLRGYGGKDLGGSSADGGRWPQTERGTGDSAPASRSFGPAFRRSSE